MQPSVWLIVPSYDGRRELAESVPTLLATDYPRFEVVIVDDASRDDTRAWIRERFPQVRVLATRSTRGFGAAANMGIRAALGEGVDYVGICNNDIRVPAGWLRAAIGALETAPGAAVVGFRELSRDDPWPVPIPEPAEVREARVAPPGMLYVCRSGLFERIGGFDESYVMYGEEDDLFARARAAGLRLLQSDLPVWHFGGATSRRTPLRSAWYSYRNSIRVSIKNHHPSTIALRLAVLLFYAAGNSQSPPRESALGRLFGATRHEHTPEELRVFRAWLVRMRPSPAALRLPLWMAAVAWNLVQLPATLQARRRDAQRHLAGVDAPVSPNTR